MLIRITSAKAIWFLASGASLSRSCSHLASATVTTASSLVLRPTFSSMKKVCATGAGSARPGGLDDDGVELALAPHQPVDDAHEVAAHGAADATVVHLEHFLVGADDQLVVDADFAELVDDDGVFLAVRLGQDAVEQRGLAGAEIAGQHRDGDLVGHAILRLATVYRHPTAGAIHRLGAGIRWRFASISLARYANIRRPNRKEDP